MKASISRKLLYICFFLGAIPFLILLVFAEFNFPILYLVLIEIPLILLTVYIIYYINVEIIKPMKLLVESAKAITQGDVSAEIEYDKNNEIGEFITAFEQMRKSLYLQKIEQSQFEIDKKSFIDSISHDMKTPIASISAYIEALEDDIAATTAERTQYFKIINDKLRNLTELSHQLSVSYTESTTLILNPTLVPIFSWTSNFLETVTVECKIKGIKPKLINVIDSKCFERILIDQYQLERAIQNIITNAYRYTVSLFVISARIHKNKFMLEIKNDGVLITEKELEKIFERFYTAEKPNNDGHLGLGLYIAKTLIESMAGKIDAELEKDLLTITIFLPLN